MANIDAFFNTQNLANQVQAGDIANRGSIFQLMEAEKAAKQREQGLAIQQKLAQDAMRPQSSPFAPEMEAMGLQEQKAPPAAPVKSDTEKAADSLQGQADLLQKTINEYRLKGLPTDQLQSQYQDVLIKGTAARRDAAKEKAEAISSTYEALNAVKDAESANIAWQTIPPEGKQALLQKAGNVLRTDESGALIYTPAVQKMFSQLSEPTKAKKQEMDIAHQAAQEAHDALVAKQTAERNAQQALNENRTAALNREKFDYERKKDAEVASTLDPKTVDFYTQQSIAGDNSWQVGLARGKVGQQLIAAVKDRIPQMAAELGLSPQDVGTNKAQNMALTKTLADRQKFSTAVEQLQGTLTKQADLVENLMKKGAAGDSSPIINKWIQAGRTATGDPDVDAFNAAIIGLAREHQRVLTSPMSNAQLHVSAQETADKLINSAKTPAQIRSVIGVMRQEVENAKKQSQETLQDVQSQLRGLGGPKRRSTDTVKSDNFVEGQIYQDASGNKAKYVGGKWVPQ